MTGYTFPIVSTISPATGDFFLTLNNLDPSIGNEGYLFQVDDTVVISAHTRTGVFYGTRTALQILHPGHYEIAYSQGYSTRLSPVRGARFHA